MDVLRARAYLDLLLGQDSRPGRDGAAASAASPGGGFAARVALTVPLATLAGVADRPGELAGLGPVDPWLARDLANAAAASPGTTWCVTVTDGQGHAVGHGCARPKPRSHRKRAGPVTRDGPGFSFAPPPNQEPGGCASREPGRICWSGSTRSTPSGVITGSRPRAMIPGSGCGTCPRSGTRPAPGPGAAGRRRDATSSTTPRTRRAGGRACVTAMLVVNSRHGVFGP
jgi:hypothetical protein